VVVSCVAILFFSCTKDDFCNCLEGTGATTTQERDIEPFTHINMGNNIDVIFTQSNSYSLRVTGGSNIIDGIKTTVEGNTLNLENKNRCNWLRDFRNEFTVRVSGPDLKGINTSGSGNFTTIDTIRTEKLRIESRDGSGTIMITADCNLIEAAIHTGPADFVLSGLTNSFGAYSDGTGFIRATGLSGDYVWSTNSGTGDISLKVSNELSVTISHTGDIYYTGDPYSISTVITGSGKLIKEQ
jgi:hypothetical protein